MDFDNISMEVILLEDKFSSINCGNLNLHRESIFDIILLLRYKWYNKGKFTLHRTSIDSILFELKSNDINFSPNEIKDNGDMFVIKLFSKINFSIFFC